SARMGASRRGHLFPQRGEGRVGQVVSASLEAGPGCVIRTSPPTAPSSLADTRPLKHSLGPKEPGRPEGGTQLEILHAAGEAFFLIFNGHTLPFLFLGVMMGLC